MEISVAGSIWYQLANFGFVCAGLYVDILLIRLFLLCANVFLIVNMLLGWPMWPDITAGPTSERKVPLDGLLWCFFGVYVHGSAFVRLILDEMPVYFGNEDEEMIWRMFYRRSGISRMLFKSTILAYGRFERFAQGEVIVQPSSVEGSPGIDKRKVYIVLEGDVHAKARTNGQERDVWIQAGDMFEFRYMNLFGVYCGYVDNEMVAKALTDVYVFSVPVADMKRMIRDSNTLRMAWYSVIIAAITKAAERPYYGRPLEDPENVNRDIFAPLSPEEEPPLNLPGSGSCFRNPMSVLFLLLRSKFAAPWPFSPCPIGVRHETSPHPPSAEKTVTKLMEMETRHSYSAVSMV